MVHQRGAFLCEGRIPIKSNEEIFRRTAPLAGPVLSTNFPGDFKIMARERRFIRASPRPFQNWNVHHKCLNAPRRRFTS